MLPQDGKPDWPLPSRPEPLMQEQHQVLQEILANWRQPEEPSPVVERLEPAPDRLARHLQSLSLWARNIANITPRAPTNQQKTRFLPSLEGPWRRPIMNPYPYQLDNVVVNQQQRDAMGAMDTMGAMGAMSAISDEVKSACRIEVLSLFPDIDPDHLTLICGEGLWQPQAIIEQILNQQEDGTQYPKAPKTNLKRKRDDEDAVSSESAAKKWDNQERRLQRRHVSYFKISHAILQQFFPQLYTDDLRRMMDQNGKLLYPTFLALHKALKEWDESKPAFRKKTRIVRSVGNIINEDTVDERIRGTYDEGEREALEEFRAARAVQLKEQAEADEVRRKEQQELENLELARIEGNISDCGCCFTECALNRMVHCDGSVLHWFCVDCARMMAETQIGLSKHNLDCMSTDGCRGGFSLDQREIFLDKHSTTALDRIQAEDYLRRAGIEDLETCPFCPYAMEYPPIEINREFRCLNEDCNMVSCRACRKETHIPKTCEEAALEERHSARHTIEEAMSAALIRKCNKCSTPFIKEHGCNKMTCTKCRNIQCYICSKSCEYSHFNDSKRGGKPGNCPLFDEKGVEVRHSEEVKTAETKARRQVLEGNSDIEADFLEIKTSERVKQDEEQRKKQGTPRGHGHVPPPLQHYPADDMPAAVRNYIEERRRQLMQVRRAARGGALIIPPQPDPGPGVPPAQEAAFPLPQDPPGLADPPAQNIKQPNPPAMPQEDFGALVADPAPGFFGGFLGDGLNQFAPGIRQSMPPHVSPAGQLPFGYANENPFRAGRAAPETGPLIPNQFDQYDAEFGLPPFPVMGGGGVFPAPPMDDFIPRHHQLYDPEARHLAPYDAGRQRPRPARPEIKSADEPRGNAFAPIDLSSPRSIVDLTNDNQVKDHNQPEDWPFDDDPDQENLNALLHGPDWILNRSGRLPEDFDWV